MHYRPLLPITTAVQSAEMLKMYTFSTQISGKTCSVSKLCFSPGVARLTLTDDHHKSFPQNPISLPNPQLHGATDLYAYTLIRLYALNLNRALPLQALGLIFSS